MAHGAGGKASHTLVQAIFADAFSNPYLDQLGDQAVLPIEGLPGALALTTDSFVVSPLFFPGGDIGELAVNGTINDLAVGGAEPLYLTAGFILEEGLPVDVLRRVVESMRAAAARAGSRSSPATPRSCRAARPTSSSSTPPGSASSGSRAGSAATGFSRAMPCS